MVSIGFYLYLYFICIIYFIYLFILFIYFFWGGGGCGNKTHFCVATQAKINSRCLPFHSIHRSKKKKEIKKGKKKKKNFTCDLGSRRLRFFPSRIIKFSRPSIINVPGLSLSPY